MHSHFAHTLYNQLNVPVMYTVLSKVNNILGILLTFDTIESGLWTEGFLDRNSHELWKDKIMS